MAGASPESGGDLASTHSTSNLPPLVHRSQMALNDISRIEKEYENRYSPRDPMDKFKALSNRRINPEGTKMLEAYKEKRNSLDQVRSL